MARLGNGRLRIAFASSSWKDARMSVESHDPDAVIRELTFSNLPRTWGEEVLKTPSLGNQPSW